MLNSKTIVFIHGLFMNSSSWQAWVTYFEKLGYSCYSPAYPFHEGEPSHLRENHIANLGKLTFDEVLNHYSKFIDKLNEKPILIGHSMGGLLTQKLISLNKGVAGICIDSAAPAGILSFKWSFLKSNLPVINPLKGNSVFFPTVTWFQYAFCNHLTLEQTQNEFDKYVVPESRNMARTSTGASGKIDLKKPHQPLLFIAGENDHIIPASLNHKNFMAYTDNKSIRTYKEFKNRTHYICGQDNWQEVAAYMQQWLTDL